MSLINQLHRSPRVFFSHDKRKTHSSGKILFSARVIPYRGSWIDLDFDHKDLLWVHIDRRHNLPATVLLKALGYTTEELLRYYYDLEEISWNGKEYSKKVNFDLLAGKRAISYALSGSGEVLVKANRIFTRAAFRELNDERIESFPITGENCSLRLLSVILLMKQLVRSFPSVTPNCAKQILKILKRRGTNTFSPPPRGSSPWGFYHRGEPSRGPKRLDTPNRTQFFRNFFPPPAKQGRPSPPNQEKPAKPIVLSENVCFFSDTHKGRSEVFPAPRAETRTKPHNTNAPL